MHAIALTIFSQHRGIRGKTFSNSVKFLKSHIRPTHYREENKNLLKHSMPKMPENLYIVLATFITMSHAFKFPSSLQEMEKQETVRCLLSGQFYHRESRQCQPPFSRGPCEAGEWLGLGSGNPGAVSCEPRPERLARCRVGLGPCGEAECQPDSEAEAGLFLPCEAGAGVRVPHNFMEDTMPCAAGFRCQARNALYMATLKEFEAKKQVGELEIEFLQGLVCDVKSKRICLPEDNYETLISAENIIKSFQRPRALCKINPCQSGKWPWLDKDGFFRCLPASKSLDKCPSRIREKDGRIFCDYLTTKSIIGYIPIRRCRRHQIFSHGRCRPRFFG